MARFLKDKRKAKGLAPGSLVFIGQQTMEHIRIHLTQYNTATFKEESVSDIRQIRKAESSPYTTWIAIHGLHETQVIAELGKQFDINPLILEDILNTDERPKFSEDEHHLFIIVKSLSFDKGTNKVKIEQISLIVGDNYLISFQESDAAHFQDVRLRLENKQSKIRDYGPDYLCYACMDTLIDNYILNIENGSFLEPLNNRSFVTFCSLTMSVISLAMVFNCCSPFNLYRTCLYIGVIVLFCLMVFVLPYIPAVTERPVTLPIDSYWNLSMQLTGIDFRDMSKTMWLVLIIYGALSTGILNILLKLFAVLMNRPSLSLTKKEEETKQELKRETLTMPAITKPDEENEMR